MCTSCHPFCPPSPRCSGWAVPWVLPSWSQPMCCRQGCGHGVAHREKPKALGRPGLGRGCLWAPPSCPSPRAEGLRVPLWLADGKPEPSCLYGRHPPLAVPIRWAAAPLCAHSHHTSAWAGRGEWGFALSCYFFSWYWTGFLIAKKQTNKKSPTYFGLLKMLTDQNTLLKYLHSSLFNHWTWPMAKKSKAIHLLFGGSSNLSLMQFMYCQDPIHCYHFPYSPSFLFVVSCCHAVQGKDWSSTQELYFSAVTVPRSSCSRWKNYFGALLSLPWWAVKLLLPWVRAASGSRAGLERQFLMPRELHLMRQQSSEHPDLLIAWPITDGFCSGNGQDSTRIHNHVILANWQAYRSFSRSLR